MTISVIVPVYNSEDFLRECIESIINQTYKELEIILVYGKSQDNSLNILKEYQEKDKRIVVVPEKQKGVSSARNTGLETAKGEWIAFIDADDTIDSNYFEKLYNAATETGADIACASILRTRKNYSKVRVKYDKKEVYTELKDKLKACNVPKCCYIWNKLYKKEIVGNLLFNESGRFEDVIWTPFAIKASNKLVVVPDINYYYRANPKSSVKINQSVKCQIDSYNAKKILIKFYKDNNLELTKKQKTVTKRLYYILNFAFLKVKEFEDVETFYLFGFIPIFKRKIKKPVIKDNTFIVCELCSVSHSEVVTGYVKYLLDLGYHVSVLVSPDRYKEGLFARFKNENITLNKMTRKEIKSYFKNDSMDDVKGVMITTAGKICDCIHFEKAYEAFSDNFDKKKLVLVEHEARDAVNNGSWKNDLVTLRKLDYKGADSVVVNPHYFGDFKENNKNEITNFITVGAIKPNKKNSQMIVDSVYEVYKEGYGNFKVTVVGKGNLKHVPKEIRKFFDVKGRLPFKKMYDEIENADFFLMSYNEYDPEHIRYNTSGTSGNYQLIYGFLKPCILTKGFAPLNKLDDNNSILYSGDENYKNALIKAIKMNNDDYLKMRNNLKNTVNEIYNESKENLKNLIEKGTNYGN